MAGKKQQKNQTVSALDFISSFILAKANKPVKQKPRKLSGVDATDAVSGAFAAIAEAPARFVSDPLMNAFDETIGGTKIFEFNIDNQGAAQQMGYDGSAGRVRVRVKDINKLLKDPNKYLDGAYQAAEQERKWASIAGAGGTLDMAAAFLWGKRQGMSTEDAMKMMGSASSLELSVNQQEDVFRSVAQNAALQAAIDSGQFGRDSNKALAAGDKFYAAVDKAGREVRGEKLKGRNVGGRIYFGSQADYEKVYKRAVVKESEGAILRSVGADEAKLYKDYKNGVTLSGADLAKAQAIENSINTQVSTSLAAEYNAANQRAQKVKSQMQSAGFSTAEIDAIATGYDKTVSDQGVGRFMYNGDPTPFAARMIHQKQLLMRASMTTDPAERERLLRAAGTINVLNRMKTPGKYADFDFAGSLSEAQQELAKARQSGSGASTEYITELEDQVKRLEAAAVGNEAKLRGQNFNQPWSPVFGGSPEPDSHKQMLGSLEAQVDFEISKLTELARKGPLSPGQMMELEQFKVMKANGLRNIPFQQYRMLFGNLDILRRTMQNQGGFIPGLFTGASFASGDAFAPGAAADVAFKFRDKGGNIKEFSQGGIVLPRDDYWRIAPGFTSLAHAYYYTPGSLVKTFLWNGEAFAYAGEMKRRQAFSAIMGLGDTELQSLFSANPQLAAEFGKLAGGFSDPKFLEFLNDNYMGIIDQIGTDPKYAALFKRLRSMEGGMARYAGLAQRFSVPMQTWNKISGLLKNSKLASGVRGGLTKLLSSLSTSPIWKAKAAEFIGGKLGLLQLMEEAAKIILKSLGVTLGGPIGYIATWILSSALTKTAFKLSKPIISLFINVFIMVAVIFLACGVAIAQFGFSAGNQPHRVTVPQRGVELAPIPGSTGNPGGQPATGNTGDAECPINTGAACNQGPFGVWSHGKMGTFAIDVGPSAGVYRAPNHGLIINRKDNVRCEWQKEKWRGGQIEFLDLQTNVVYRILHIDPIAPQGPVSKGQVLGTMSVGLGFSKCWSGPHYHLDTKVSGGWVNSEDWYNKLGCNLARCP